MRQNDDQKEEEIDMGGQGSGRLRTHDRDQIAIDMLEWVKKDASLNLNGFCAEQLISPSKITNWAKEEEFFRQAYELTKAVIANRREQKLSKGELHVKSYDLNATVYDHFLREERRSQSIFDAELSAKVAKEASKDESAAVQSLLDALNKMRDDQPQSTTPDL